MKTSAQSFGSLVLLVLASCDQMPHLDRPPAELSAPTPTFTVTPVATPTSTATPTPTPTVTPTPIPGPTFSNKFDWALMGGSLAVNQQGTYSGGTLLPGGRMAAGSWVDAGGSLWMFGGYGDAGGGQGFLADVWKYDPVGGLWSFMGGATQVNSNGNFGLLGTGSSSYFPSSRYYPSAAIDPQGNAWIFGGCRSFSVNPCTSYVSDLFEYQTSTGEWVWVAGQNISGGYNAINQAGTFGTNYGSSGNPGGRFGAAMWSDASGNLFLFGGFGLLRTSGVVGNLNDLWEYSVSQKEWIWTGGEKDYNFQGTYGAAPGSSGYPGARQSFSYWKDGAGSFWLFGGFGYGTQSNLGGNLNDLWKYDPVGAMWTWVAGGAAVGIPTTGILATWGSSGVGDPSFVPGVRDNSVGWSDPSGNIWIFGGEFGGLSFNDVWEYDTTPLWRLMGGYPVAGSFGASAYGSLGTASTTFFPGGRNQTTAWMGTDGSIWIFGGVTAIYSTGFLGDLWHGYGSY